MENTIEVCRQKLFECGAELENGIKTLRITARCVPPEVDGVSEDRDRRWDSYCGHLLGELRTYGCLTETSYVEDAGYQDTEYETWEEYSPIGLKIPDAKPSTVDNGVAFEMEEPDSTSENPVMGLSFRFTAVERVVVDEDNPYFCARDGVLFSKDMTRLIWYPYGKQGDTYIVPDGVKEIGPWAFAGNVHTYLVRRKDGSAVAGKHYTKYVFNKILRRVILPDTVEAILDHAFDHCIFLKSVKLACVKEIQGDAFRGCKALWTLELPDSLEFIAPAFKGCNNLKEVRFLGTRRQLRNWKWHSRSGNQYLGPLPYSPPFMRDVFGHHPYKKNQLGQYVQDTHITYMPEISADHPQFVLEDGVMFSRDRTELIWCDPGRFGSGHLSEDKFCIRHWEPDEHSTYTVPDTVVRIGDQAFEKCVGLTQITISHPDTVIGNRAFFGCTHLRRVVFQNSGSVRRIGDNAFQCCNELREPPLSGVEHIGDFAFYACGSLGATITVPKSCRHLGEKAFDGCHRPRSLRIPEALPPYSLTYGVGKDVRSVAALRY